MVGEGLRTTPGIAARVFETIRDINVSLISQGASRVNLTFVVDEGQASETVTRLHAALLEGPAVERGKRSQSRRPTARPSDSPTAVDLTRRLIDVAQVELHAAEQVPRRPVTAIALHRAGQIDEAMQLHLRLEHPISHELEASMRRIQTDLGNALGYRIFTPKVR